MQGHRPVPRDAWDGDCTPVFKTQGHRPQPGDAWGGDSSLLSNTGDIDQILLEGRRYMPQKLAIVHLDNNPFYNWDKTMIQPPKGIYVGPQSYTVGQRLGIVPI